MVGEFGAYNKTPHPVALCWMRDYVDLWPAAGWGWAMWNSTGPMGIVDSDRADVEYENWHGHKVAREMQKPVQGRKAGLSGNRRAVSGAGDLFQAGTAKIGVEDQNGSLQPGIQIFDKIAPLHTGPFA